MALLAMVAALALTTKQASPPTIAEFAPQAVEQITESAGASGSAQGAPESRRTIDAGTGDGDVAQQTIDVARVRQCVGDPPRQIEDPQSPPCVPYWSGDNGGATWRGVTRDEIRVTDSSLENLWGPALADFFNRRFEFYGRRIRLTHRSFPGVGDDVAQRAAARAAYEEDRSFASAGSDQAGSQTYHEELARYGIVGATEWSYFPETYLASRRPYLWTYPMANDRMFAMAGAWYCARFAGRNAAHAGDPLLQASRRKPGILFTESPGWEGTSAEPLNAQLATCASRADAVVRGTGYGGDEAFFQNAILQMKTSGVTTVACLCNVFVMGFWAMRAATNQGYFPEWLVTSYIGNEWATYIREFGRPEQARSLMALLAHPMHRPCADHPSVWAIQNVGNTGCPTKSAPWTRGQLDTTYWPFLLLASGLQMAGPHLTPETFERGLHAARFPNPSHRIMAGAAGFNDGDHSMTDDAAEAWWSNTAQSPDADDGVGAYCYVGLGARRRIGTFPTDDPFFAGPCHSGAV